MKRGQDKVALTTQEGWEYRLEGLVNRVKTSEIRIWVLVVGAMVASYCRSPFSPRCTRIEEEDTARSNHAEISIPAHGGIGEIRTGPSAVTIHQGEPRKS